MEFVISLLKSAMNATVKEVGFGDPELVQRKIIELLRDDLGRATYQFVTAGTRFDPMVLWRWLTASGISARERDALRVTSDLTEADPERLANVLIGIARLTQMYEGKTLVITYDELDRAGALGPDTVGTFSTAFTRLCEPAQTYCAVFLSGSAARIEDIPDIISAPVRSRLGRDIVEIPSMTSDDVEPFIQDLVDYIRAQEADVDKLIEQAKEETDEQIVKEFYPFTSEAIEGIKSACGQIITPRDICLFMSKATSLAKKRRKHVVTKKDISTVAGIGS